MDKTFIKALKEVVREEIVKNNGVEIDGLGRFELVHKKQRQEKRDNGQVLMLPPRNEVRFTPGKT